jgi:hypothetical protein
VKRTVFALLALCVFFTAAACRRQGEPVFIPDKEPQSQSEPPPSDEPQQPVEPQSQSEPPPSDEPQQPVEPQQGEEIPFPGLPVYVEAKQPKTAPQAADSDPDGEPQPTSPGLPAVFDHFDDPPPKGQVRLVYVYDYGETEVLLIDDSRQVREILDMVDAFAPSDYSSGPQLGGYLVQIQAVRDGVHQCYSVFSARYNGGRLAANRREATGWYETSAENLQLLMDYFGGLPG